MRQEAERGTPWALILAGWTAWGLVSAAGFAIHMQLRGAPLGWRALVLQLPQAWLWALATPGILWLGRRLPLQRGRLLQHSLAHMAISLSLVFAIHLVYAWHTVSLVPSEAGRPVLESVASMFPLWGVADATLYWVVLLADQAAQRERRLREREVTAAQLETRLVEATLQALKMQLHPHFLFNALHTIGGLVRSGDRDRAVLVVTRLGELLRTLLDEAASQEVPLEQELAFVTRYLDIEQVRFRDRLEVTIDVAPETRPARVPHLVLQPLVENAIRHGVAPHAAGGRIRIAARRQDGRLELIVADNGPGLDAGKTRMGIGLGTTRARLDRLYGDDYTLELTEAGGGGLEARLSLPFSAARPALAPA